MENRIGDPVDRFSPQGLIQRPKGQISALEQLDRHPRLVLLGDPGSGKSTFVNFVALCLAGEVLGKPGANLKLLTAPLPEEDRQRERPRPQSWSHGALLPVRVVLRDFAARGLPPAGERASAKHLWSFIVADLEEGKIEGYAGYLEKELREKGGLILLDGLDEVPEAEQRRAQICQCVEDFAAAFPRCRYLVTSRTYAYQNQDWRLRGFAETTLAPFSRGQIRQFVDRWYAHIAALRGLDPQDAQGRAELLKRAILGSDRLYGLAERPLLLTLMASLHAWRGGALPEKREELYADTVDLLLDWWESPKVVRNKEGESVVSQPSLAEYLKVDRQKLRGLLHELAFKAHAAQPELKGTADIAEDDLVAGLMRLSQNPDVRPARLVEYLSARAGLLVPRGVGVYTFPHRTFQEYLAACYLTDHDYPERLAELACSDLDRWREVALLAGAKAGRGSTAAVWSLADALCYQEFGDPEQAGEVALAAWHGALLAGQALAENIDPAAATPRNRPKLERVRKWLVQLLQRSPLPARERAVAGDLLAELGDPRFNKDLWYLPDEPLLGFVRIPAGPFVMGSNPRKDKYAKEEEQPQHSVDLPEYYLSRYPTTVAQFRAFIRERGQPPKDPDSLRDPDNRPVRWVNWYEAVEYCRWLGEKLRALAEARLKEGLPPEQGAFWRRLRDGELVVGLPSEAEWEKAARGVDGRVYPWEGGFDPDKANTDETGLGDTSAVGCFPGGASPYGLLDLSGNVWEWTRSLYRKYPYPDDPQARREREDLQAEGPRVPRGGSFIYNQWNARCAARNWFAPDLGNRGFGFRVGASLLPLGSGGSGALGL